MHAREVRRLSSVTPIPSRLFFAKGWPGQATGHLCGFHFLGHAQKVRSAPVEGFSPGRPAGTYAVRSADWSSGARPALADRTLPAGTRAGAAPEPRIARGAFPPTGISQSAGSALGHRRLAAVLPTHRVHDGSSWI